MFLKQERGVELKSPWTVMGELPSEIRDFTKTLGCESRVCILSMN
jgi:hypothetical protein